MRLMLCDIMKNVYIRNVMLMNGINIFRDISIFLIAFRDTSILLIIFHDNSIFLIIFHDIICNFSKKFKYLFKT